MVNRPDQVYVERDGRLEPTDAKFLNEDQVRAVIQRIVQPLGRHVDESVPYVDARLPDGSRVHAIIPPLALHGAKLTIRKFSKYKLTTDDLLRLGSLSPQMARFLE
ncbi:CpaF family protein, partial [candidate division WOR-3 bacterium]|nr:CpaF family protein [candidate division WOR-3 bacterium]